MDFIATEEPEMTEVYQIASGKWPSKPGTSDEEH